MLKNQKIVEIIGDKQCIQKLISNDILNCNDSQKINSYVVCNMLKDLGENIEPGDYILRYEKTPTTEDNNCMHLDGINYTIKLIPIKIKSMEG